MSASSFALGAAWSYGIAVFAYAAFAARAWFGSRRSPRARLLVFTLLATAFWAGLCILVGMEPTRSRLLAASGADAVRLGMWLLFLWHLLTRSETAPAKPHRFTRNAFIAVSALLMASVFLGEGTTWWQSIPLWSARAGYLLKLGLAVFALVVVEQVYRIVPPQTRWAIRPLAVALVGVFGFELYFYADAALFGRLDADVWIARGIANVIVIPFLAVATARNTGWTVDLHLSRSAVFHSSALLISGVFLLLVAAAGYVVQYVGGDWGRALEIELLFVAALVALLVATSGRFRARLKVFISKHFFSYRYDYREEWLRFTRTLSLETGTESLQVRTIIALADLLESPAGALWLKDDAKDAFLQAARWNSVGSDASEPGNGSLATFLAKDGWVIDLSEYRADPSRYPGLTLPVWLGTSPATWLVNPLLVGNDLIGFVLLETPRTRIEIDWEVRDLLKTASRQAASFLSHARATEALLEARKFDAFNRMSAFVVHDLKNLVAQLSLMLSNAQRHRDNPAFQADMLTTVEHVVGRMNGLMQQLRAGSETVENLRPIDIEPMLQRVCGSKSAHGALVELVSVPGLIVAAHEARLEHVLGHLLQNAIDAACADSSTSGRVVVRAESHADAVVIAIADNGPGMTSEFIRDRLFRPFQTTKPSGMGIGAYESAQYVGGLGGALDVESAPGCGTTVRIRLPRVLPTDRKDVQPVSENAA